MKHVYDFIVTDSGAIVVKGATAMNEELKKHIGQRGSMTLHFIDERDTSSMIGHIKYKVAPALQKAFYENGMILTEENALYKMWLKSEVVNEKPFDLNALEYHEIVLFMADISRIAAEYLKSEIS
jgi:hypothetical protein